MQLEPYTLATNDVSAFQNVQAAGNAKLELKLFDADGQSYMVTGTQKLAQRFMLRLLTPSRGMSYLPGEGTDFVSRLRAGMFRTTDSVYSAFAIAETQMAAQFAVDTRESDTLNEQYRDARLTSVVLQPGYAKLNIQLRSRAETLQIVLPVPVTIR